RNNTKLVTTETYFSGKAEHSKDLTNLLAVHSEMLGSPVARKGDSHATFLSIERCSRLLRINRSAATSVFTKSKSRTGDAGAGIEVSHHGGVCRSEIRRSSRTKGPPVRAAIRRP